MKYYTYDYDPAKVSATTYSPTWESIGTSLSAKWGVLLPNWIIADLFIQSEATATRSNRRYRLANSRETSMGGISYREEEIHEPLHHGEDTLFDGTVYFGSGGWDSQSPRAVTRERYLISGPFKERIAWRLENDEVLTTWSYALDPVTGVETTVSQTGVPDLARTSVAHGTRQETRLDRTGLALFSELRDIASGHVLALEEVLERDPAGRPTLLSFLDGTTEERTYSPCCGLLESSTRDGRSIFYGYDLLGRKIRQEENGVVIHFDLDGDGRVIRERREGADQTEIVVLTRVYDKAGRLTSETDAENRPTRYQTQYLADGGRRETTTYPDEATVVMVFNADGTPRLREGSAASYATWTYEVAETAEGDVTAVTEHKTATEWVRTLQDMRGRKLKAIYPDDAEETFAYDLFDRPLKVVDADGVTTL